MQNNCTVAIAVSAEMEQYSDRMRQGFRGGLGMRPVCYRIDFQSNQIHLSLERQFRRHRSRTLTELMIAVGGYLLRGQFPVHSIAVKQ